MTDQEIIERFRRLYFKAWVAAPKTWMGTQIVKYPTDLFLYQMIIHEKRPDFIVETGSYMGGSALFFATMCELAGHGHVISVDKTERERPQHPRLTYVIGRATADDTLARVRGMVGDGSCMVVLDSDHRANHVKREMVRYGRDMVTVGQYMIVEDTMLDGHSIDWAFDVGPGIAVKWFLERCDDFKVMPLENYFLMSVCPGGFLLRTKEDANAKKNKNQAENKNQSQADTTIIYYTDNSIPEEFARKVQKHLLAAAQGKPIISVSQKPIDFGRNIPVGNIGRSHQSMFYQIMLGCEAAETRYVAMAEHDCLYTPEHFNWTPPRDDVFYYNVNSWFAQYDNEKHGEYSYYRRRPMSQLICNRELCIAACKEKVEILALGHGEAACEPGIKEFREQRIRDDLGKEGTWRAEAFRTENPNLDIRHGTNFSGPRINAERASHHTYQLPYWGRLSEVL